jgi:hypothetical protein
MPGFLFAPTMAGDRYRAVNPDALCNVTLKRRLRARRDIPVMHTAPQLSDGEC